MEYLLLIGGAVLIAVIILSMILGLGATAGSDANSTTNAGFNLTDKKRCEVFGGTNCGPEPPATCIAPSDCDPAPECKKATCDAGTCGTEDMADGTSCDGGAGVCNTGICSSCSTCADYLGQCGLISDGCGGTLNCGCTDPGIECQSPVCSAGACGSEFDTYGTSCNGGSGICDGAGNCTNDFYDDFEDGDSAGWIADGLSISVASGQMTYDAGFDGIAYTSRSFTPPYTFSWTAKSMPEAYHSFVVGANGLNTSTNMVLIVMVKSNGIVYWYRKTGGSYWSSVGSSVTGQPLSSNDNFSISVSGSLITIQRNGTPFTSRTMSFAIPVGGVGFRDYTINEKGTVDNVRVALS